MLRHWPNLVEENEQISWHPWVSWHDINGERFSGPVPVFDLKKQDLQIFRHSRPLFHDLLSKQVEKEGVKVEYGFEVTEYHDENANGKAHVTLANGDKLEADLVVAADGIGSNSSGAVTGGVVRARPTGFAIYRTAFPVEIAYKDPMVKERFKPLEDGTPVIESWAG